MKTFIQQPKAIGLMLTILLSGYAMAHDTLAPCWRGTAGSTFQRWDFNSSANPASPDNASNPYGSASASMTVVSPGLGWVTSVSGYGTNENYWGLAGGSMVVTVPNSPGLPVTSWKLVSLQIAQFVDGGIFQDAAATLPGAVLLDVANVQYEAVPPSGGWQVRRFLWRVEPSPTSETITITKGAGDDLFIDQIIVDTLAITDPNIYVDDSYTGSDCAQKGWPDAVAPLDKPLGILAYADLQTGVNRAPTNGTVLVAEGDYVGPININKPVTLAPGPNTTTIGIAGPFTLGSSATLALDINGTTPGTGHDQIAVFGAVSLGGAALNLTSSTPLPLNSTIRILDKLNSGAITGTFAGWPEGSTNLVGGQQFKITYAGGTGNDVVLTMVNNPPVPVAKTAQTFQNQTASLYAAKVLVGATDPDPGDVVSFAGVVPTSANGGTVVSNLVDGVPAATYTPPTDFVGIDTFQYLLTDGKAVSVGTVTVTVISTNAASFNMLDLTPAPGGPIVRFTGVPGNTYQLQRSIDSATGPWTTIATITLPPAGNGIGQHQDTTVFDPEPTSRFYRTRYVTP